MTTSPTINSAAIAADIRIEQFVAQYENRPRQRTPLWLAARPHQIGSSEVAGLMGLSSYANMVSVVASKAGLRTWSGGSVACWWGTMFETAIERVVAIDCGTRLRGTDISVPSSFVGHANSPDGYCALNLFLTTEGQWEIASTDGPAVERARDRPVITIIVLLEFKCPYRRQPKKGIIPKHYRPQLWSGLGCAPIANYALFVDAVFRKCSLWNLGNTTGYDWTYHRERKSEDWTTPVAWGFTAVFAPDVDTPRGRPLSREEAEELGDGMEMDFDVDYGREGWNLHHRYFGIPYDSSKLSAREGRPFCPELIDFGDCDKEIFETMLRHLNDGGFPSKHVGPCFPDGRGAALLSDTEIGAAIDAESAAPPPGHFLLGVIPWKLFEREDIFEPRRPGFFKELRPLIAETLAAASTIRGAENPQLAFTEFAAKHRQRKQRKRTGKKGARAPKTAVSPENLQSLFDAC